MPLDMSAAHAAVDALQGQHGQLVALAVDAATAPLLARIAELEAAQEPDPEPDPEPVLTKWGTNGSDVSEWNGNAAFHPKAVRYFHQPGEGVWYPPNSPKAGDRVQIGPDVVYIYSSKVTPQAILSGTWDDDYERMFRAAPTDRPYYVCIWHEPEDDIESGAFTAAELNAAHRHVTAIARQVGPHIKMVPILMQFTLQGGKGRKPMDYWPGDEYVDAVGVDCYQWTRTNEGDTPGQLYDSAIAFAKARNKPLIVAETGIDVTAFGSGRAAAIRDAAEALANADVPVLAVAYFNRSRWVLSGADLDAWLGAQV